MVARKFSYNIRSLPAREKTVYYTMFGCASRKNRGAFYVVQITQITRLVFVEIFIPFFQNYY